MSYRRERTHKARRAKTAKQLRQVFTRDLRFCERWGIPLDDSWKWDRYPLRGYKP